MWTANAYWTDARLDQFAATFEPLRARVAVLDATVKHLDHLAGTLEPLPAEVAMLAATVKHLDHLAIAIEPVPAKVAVLGASADRLAEENRALREELAATQHQIIQIAWGLIAALIGALGAIITALV
jgi:outer membrane murein-binding lipoprotein Lpp